MRDAIRDKEAKALEEKEAAEAEAAAATSE